MFHDPQGKMAKGKSNNNNLTAGAGSGSSSSFSSPPPPWIELPKDLTINILGRLYQGEILERVQHVCTTWNNVCSEPSFWRVIQMYADDFDYLYKYSNKLCRRAVDRSQGELIDIAIRDFGTNELLQYISDGSSNLKRLTLVGCSRISLQGLVTAIKNFPHLEELHLYNMRLDFNFDMETIGISCPSLKSFSFNERSFVLPMMKIISNAHALSIAKTMPKLCCLGLVGNRMSNEGLQAILDGCPCLQSLDIRLCFNVDLESDLWKRCSERIKELKCSPTSIRNDYQWSGDDMVYVDEEEDYNWYCDNDFINSDHDDDYYF